MFSSRVVTLFTVSGPSSGTLFDGSEFSGGWPYLAECIEYLALISSPQLIIQLHVAHHLSWGPFPESYNYKNLQVFCHNYSDDVAGNLSGGHQHAMLLNRLLKDVIVTGQVYGFIDPDCYVLDSKSFSQVVKEIEEEKLDGFGVPYPEVFPKSYYWDFPTAYFSLFSIKTVNPMMLDFSLAGGDVETSISMKLFSSVMLRRVFRLVNAARTSSNVYINWLYRLAYNIHQRKIEVSKDTGWQNRLALLDKNLRLLIAKSVARPAEVVLPFFNELNYLNANPDVANSGLNAKWHFLFHGIFENRLIGEQNVFWTFMHAILRSSRELRMHDPSNIIVRKRFLLNHFTKVEIGELESAHEYELYSRPFCIHLGHSSKRNLSRNTEILRELKIRLASDN